MKKNNKKGFTLAELLIVVAIIAVLTAIAIPVFNKQLEKSRDATSIANMRSAYAEAQTTFLTGDDSTTVTSAITNGAGTITVTGVRIMSKVADSWSGLADDLPFDAPADTAADGAVSMVFTYADNELDSVAFGS